MSKIKTALYLLKNNKDIFIAQILQNVSFLFSDMFYLKLMFRFRMGYSLNLKNPSTFNEKLNWLKIYDHNPLYSQLVDKEAVKRFVAEKIGSKYIIPTIYKWNTPEDIDMEILPQRFVLKTTMGGGNEGVIICKNKETFNIDMAMNKLRKAMKQDLYRDSREWPYKNVKKQIICEPYIEDERTGELRDYKFFCFDGDVKALFVATERQNRTEPFFNFFDENYNPLPIKQGHPISDTIPSKPESFEEMKQVASLLSKGFPHVRVDLYEANGCVLFGELTFYHFGAVVPFEPSEWDEWLGKFIKLPC